MSGKSAAEIHRRQPTQERARRTVQSIIDASAQILERHGYEAATTNRIAERAGTSVGTLYQYFNNKDEIFDALVEREANAYLLSLKKALPKAGAGPKQAIQKMLEAGFAHTRLIMGLVVNMRYVPNTVYARRGRMIVPRQRQWHRLAVEF